jgi:putative ABC transport system substrate-binding protein
MLPSHTFSVTDEGRLPTIGELWYVDAAGMAPYQNAFRSGLRELGYVEGRNVTIVALHADGDPARLPALAAKLVAMNVDVMVVSVRAVDAAKRATATIPIVCPGFTDPVAEGHVSSLAHPGGNITGLSWQSSDASGKRVQLAIEVIRDLRQLGVLFDASDAAAVVDAKAVRDAARRAGVKVREFPVRDSDHLESALAAIRRSPPQALIVPHTPLTIQHRDRIMRFAAGHKVPVVSEGRNFAEAGALLTYGAYAFEIFKRGAVYVDKILKGAKPSELPIEQPTKFELVVNLRAAKALGLTIPQPVLERASEVIQ